MQGFDPQFADLPDYILKITEEIWEHRGLATLRRYYADDVIMRTPMGVVRGNEAVINGTLATIAEFPDRQLFGEDVIWSGNERVGFLSSHRILSVGTHSGFGFFGAPTGRRIAVRAIADCAAAGNMIYDEWLTRDTSAMALQLGLDPAAHARSIIEREGGAASAKRPFTPADDVSGRYQSKGNDNPWGQRLADVLTRIMTMDFAVIAQAYDRAVKMEHPGLRSGWGRASADAAWVALRASFPSARFEVHHMIGREDPHQPDRAAVRWSLTGAHDGFGAYGAPTGAPVHIMGITHAEWGPWGLKHEFTVFDEIAIWKQILLHTGAHERPNT
jgi:hypothetical protein